MAELVREVYIEATPEVIFPFLVEPGEVRPVGRAASPCSTPVRVGRTGRSWAARTGPRANSSRSNATPASSSASAGPNPTTPSPPAPPPSRSTWCPRGAAPPSASPTATCPATPSADHTAGWDHYLARLATVTTGGDPGPDRMG